MRILHTADWHLGRTLHQADLSEDHREVLDFLVDLVAEREIDCVLVSGDVYDRALPSVRAVRQLHDVLSRLTEHADVILTAGNHDSATRLGFLEGLTSERLHLRTHPHSGRDPIHLISGANEVWVFALPYLDVDEARRAFPDADGQLPERSHEAVLRAALADLAPQIRTVREHHPQAAIVIAAHAFVAGGSPADSERDIRVGGVDRVPVDVFTEVEPDYVALGHLHRPQQVTPTVRYSGSPLAFSFSEVNDTKSVTLLEFTGREVTFETIETPVVHPLVERRGLLEDILHSEDVPAHAFVKVILTDTYRPRDYYLRVKERFANLLSLTHEPEVAPERVDGVRAAQLHAPLDVVTSFLTQVTGAPPSETQRALVRASVEELLAEERRS
ncbi:MAG: exonuclease subunit SbcD [Bowdeniella nasicola]|nr:exonuclease subunit SbcD [Bowdeniella nasicola]